MHIAMRAARAFWYACDRIRDGISPCARGRTRPNEHRHAAAHSDMHIAPAERRAVVEGDADGWPQQDVCVRHDHDAASQGLRRVPADTAGGIQSRRALARPIRESHTARAHRNMHMFNGRGTHANATSAVSRVPTSTTTHLRHGDIHSGMHIRMRTGHAPAARGRDRHRARVPCTRSRIRICIRLHT